MNREPDLLRIAAPPTGVPLRHDVQAFPGVPASVPRARRHVRSVLLAWGQPQLEEAGGMLVTELATNAVLHAASDMRVELLDAGDGVVVLVVGDGSALLPVKRRHAREASTGRGLWLLDHFSSDRGVELAAGGKRVWAVLCPEPAGPGEDLAGGLAARLDEAEPA